MKTTKQVLYDEGSFEDFGNADQVLKNYLFSDESNERRRPDIQELNDESVNQGVYSKIRFKNTTSKKIQFIFFFVFEWCINLFRRCTILK